MLSHSVAQWAERGTNINGFVVGRINKAIHIALGINLGGGVTGWHDVRCCIYLYRLLFSMIIFAPGIFA